MEVTHELIEKLAQLSRLQIDEARKITLRNDLQQMISFVEKLQELDTTGVEPLQHLSQAIHLFREDKITPPLSREKALASATLKDESFFLVPKAIQKQEA
jgi:aspartyl-tRNA(Asn)/glutamyl-tRNA(Gln) amidotransferase subunit C